MHFYSNPEDLVNPLLKLIEKVFTYVPKTEPKLTQITPLRYTLWLPIAIPVTGKGVIKKYFREVLDEFFDCNKATVIKLVYNKRNEPTITLVVKQKKLTTIQEKKEITGWVRPYDKYS